MNKIHQNQAFIASRLGPIYYAPNSIEMQSYMPSLQPALQQLQRQRTMQKNNQNALCCIQFTIVATLKVQLQKQVLNFGVQRYFISQHLSTLMYPCYCFQIINFMETVARHLCKTENKNTNYLICIQCMENKSKLIIRCPIINITKCKTKILQGDRVPYQYNSDLMGRIQILKQSERTQLRVCVRGEASIGATMLRTVNITQI